MRIYMSRHGESVNNTLNIIGGDCGITEKGKEYGKFLGKYFSDVSNLTVWTSSLIRTKETVSNISTIPVEWENLNEINSGDFDGFVLDDVKKNYQKLYHLRNNDKLNNSYPNGESYLDLYKRVSCVLDKIDMTKDGTLLIVAHRAVCRVIYSYFTQTHLSECTNMKIDLHTLYELKKNKFIINTQIKLLGLNKHDKN